MKIPVFIGGVAGNNSLTITAGASNVTGLWISYGSVPYPVDHLIFLVDIPTAAIEFVALFNIGIGIAGSQEILIPNIPIFSINSSNSTYPQYECFFDISTIPPNTQIWINCQSSVGSTFAPRVSLGVQFKSHQKSPVFQTLGADITTSGGTPFSYGANAFGAWQSVGSVLNHPSRKMYLMAQRDPVSLNTINLGIGPISPPQIIAQNIPISWDSSLVELEGFFPPGNYWVQGQGTEVYTSQFAAVVSF